MTIDIIKLWPSIAHSTCVQTRINIEWSVYRSWILFGACVTDILPIHEEDIWEISQREKCCPLYIMRPLYCRPNNICMTPSAAAHRLLGPQYISVCRNDDDQQRVLDNYVSHKLYTWLFYLELNGSNSPASACFVIRLEPVTVGQMLVYTTPTNIPDYFAGPTGDEDHEKK
jgi:hypothetical protein